MSTVRSFEDLEAWQLARKLNRDIYETTRSNPFAKDFALRDQIRRASVSVMANIAEGFESRTDGLFIEFLGRAKGSSGEVRCHLSVAHDIGYIPQDTYLQLPADAARVSRWVSGLLTYLKDHRFPTRGRVQHNH